MRATRWLPILGVTCALASFGACGSSPGGGRASGDGGTIDAAGGLKDGGAMEGDGDGAISDGGSDDATFLDGGGDTSVDAAPGDANGPLFACGPTLECYQYVQFCGLVTGPHGGMIDSCNDEPDACVNGLTCACLATTGLVTPCSGSTEDGGITVTATE